MFNSKHDMLQERITKAIDEIWELRKEIDRLKSEKNITVKNAEMVISGGGGGSGSSGYVGTVKYMGHCYSEIPTSEAVKLIVEHLGLEIKKESKQERVYLEKKNETKSKARR